MKSSCRCDCNPDGPGVSNCAPDCSAFCNTSTGNCFTTKPTGTDLPCNTYGAWSACVCSQSAYSGCAITEFCGQIRYCADPPTSNQYQIGCCTPDSSDATPDPTSPPVYNCQNLYYCNTNTYTCVETSAAYDTNTHYQCPNSTTTCEQVLNSSLPGQTTGLCYDSLSFCQANCLSPAFTKLKNTSFYSSRPLFNPLPQTPSAYDASANFIAFILSAANV